MKCIPAMMLFVLAVFTGSGADFRLSLLDDPLVLEDTCQLLKRNEFSGDSVAKFKKLVEDYNGCGNRVDQSKFPPSRNGYYDFGSFDDFTNRMVRSFYKTPGSNKIPQTTLMCVDVACLLLNGAGCGAPRLEKDFASKDFVYVKGDGSLAPAGIDTSGSALCPAKMYERLVGRPRSEAETQLGISLRALRRLPAGCTNSETDLRSIFATLISDVKRDGFKFPENCQVGLELIVNTKLHYIGADHAFVCIPKQGRYICLEKNGSKGPFVRVEFKSENDLAQYMSWDPLVGDTVNPKGRDYGSSVLISLNSRLIGIYRPSIP